MLMEVRAVGPFFKNGFVLGCETTHDAVLIDPGDEIDDLLAAAGRQSLTIRHILLTHAHIDHITGVGAAKKAIDAPVYLHRDDLFLYERAVEMGAMFGMKVQPAPPVDIFYTAGQIIPFGGYEAVPHHTPGHCPGGVCLEIRKKGEPGKDLVVGDTLFAGSIGRTDLPGGSLPTLLASIRNVLFPFGDDARVHPGHGPSTTIGQERRANPFLQDAV
jgi:hydroxyacylglutathione hydrolase